MSHSKILKVYQQTKTGDQMAGDTQGNTGNETTGTGQ